MCERKSSALRHDKDDKPKSDRLPKAQRTERNVEWLIISISNNVYAKQCKNSAIHIKQMVSMLVLNFYCKL